MVFSTLAAAWVLLSVVGAEGSSDHGGHGHGDSEDVTLPPATNVCAHGLMQSPIDIHSCQAHHQNPEERENVETWYGSHPAKVTRTGEKLLVEVYGEASTIPSMAVGHDHYRMRSCEIRMPAEHHIDGKYYPLGVTCVHSLDHSGTLTEPGRWGIVSVFFDDMSDNGESEYLAQFDGNLPANEEGQVGIVEELNFDTFMPEHSSRYYTYRGSFTDGDCREAVNWIVMADPVSTTQEQLNMFELALNGTLPRAPQPLFGREVEGCPHHAGATRMVPLLSFVGTAAALLFSLAF